MKVRANATVLQVGDRHPSQESYAEPGSGLEVNVVYTTPPGALAALRTAGTRQLEARVRLLVPQAVPHCLPVTRPPVPIAFTEARCRRMALECSDAVEVQIHVYLCRDRRQGLRAALKPHSLVVVGGSRRWWRTPEEKLATLLRSDGHHVIFADANCGPAPAAPRAGTT